MKKVKSAILIFLIAFGFAHGGWEKIEGNFGTYKKVQFVDPQYGWVIAGRYTIEHSNDSGKTWNAVERIVNTYMNYVEITDLYFFNRNVGVIVGNSPGPDEIYSVGVVYKTTDGGANIRKIVFPTPTTGYFFAEKQGDRPPKIMGRTTDGGSSWVLEAQEMTGGDSISIITDAFFINKDTGWVVGTREVGYASHSIFLKTVDGGESWESKRYKHRGASVYIVDDIRSVFFPVVNLDMWEVLTMFCTIQ
jgi:photosystem II stability/assembly factor-like uncharacterized protein